MVVLNKFKDWIYLKVFRYFQRIVDRTCVKVRTFWVLAVLLPLTVTVATKSPGNRGKWISKTATYDVTGFTWRLRINNKLVPIQTTVTSSQLNMTQQAAALQSYNNELVKCKIFILYVSHFFHISLIHSCSCFRGSRFTINVLQSHSYTFVCVTVFVGAWLLIRHNQFGSHGMHCFPLPVLQWQCWWNWLNWWCYTS